ncbi:MAG: hypothetical protein Q9210_004045 [Variospora velana]
MPLILLCNGTYTSVHEKMAVSPEARPVMPSGVKPQFYVSTYNASQFYQPLPPKWLKARTTVPKNFEKGAKDALKALETLTDVRTKLEGFDTDQIDLLVDHKINMNAQFTPRNAFDVSEDLQLERVSRLAEVRRKLATTNYGLPNLDEVLKAAFENLILATGISRSHSFLTARVPVVSVRGPTFNISSTDPTSSVELFFDDRNRQIRLHQSGKQFQYDGQEIRFALRDIWKASWAEHSAKVVLYLIKTEGEMRYESYMLEMKATGDARGFLQKMSGIVNFKLCRLER